MKLSEVKKGVKVSHRNHGEGTIVAVTGDPSSAIVQFDHEVEFWGTDTLEVSIHLLTVRKVSTLFGVKAVN